MHNTFTRLILGITKVYLIPCNDGYMLIDTGYKNNYKKFVKLLEKTIKFNYTKWTYQISWVHFALGTLKDNKLPLVANKGH